MTGVTDFDTPDLDSTDLDTTLVELAHAYGVATEYWDWRGAHVQVPADTLVAVLGALGVDATTLEAQRDALETRTNQAWTRTLPPYVVTRAGRESVVRVHVTDGQPVNVWIEFEDGTALGQLRQGRDDTPARPIGDRMVGQATFVLPAELPLGYHRLCAYSEGQQSSAALIVTPSWVGLPARLGARKLWGLTTQLYSVVSHRSWGVGDLADLADLAGWAGAEHDAAFVLVNPLHAAEPVAPMEPSPYLPTTRRFANPLYLRVEQIPEYAYLNAPTRAQIDAIRTEAADDDADHIDRDRAWTAKRAALEILRHAGLAPGRQLAFAAFCRREGDALTDFATWAVLVDEHGVDWHEWPDDLRHPHNEAVTRFRTEHAEQIDLHRWLQWVLDEQLDVTQAAARRAGMALGVVHDLAVGVSPNGSDAWARQDDLARGITVGAPPDAYNQIGQDWSQPPWRPDRLADQAYEPIRELIANVLRHAGGLRVDHIIGLFRLWWIPAGGAPTEGTYVRYDHDALIGILALEAHRADAVIIGEDLGTVEPWVRDYLRERGLLGTSILWFERDFDHPAADGSSLPLPAERWREYSLASVTTHDLPPTAGYLAGDHVRLRHRLGLLTRSLEDELATDRAEQAAWLDELRHRGMLAADADIDQTVLAMHRYLAAAPSRLRSLSLTDAVGDRRTQNQPGTIDEYPNWRVPLTGPNGERVWLEDVYTSARAAALAETMRGDG
jgi:4-alpha-glucanotransferase